MVYLKSQHKRQHSVLKYFEVIRMSILNTKNAQTPVTSGIASD